MGKKELHLPASAKPETGASFGELIGGKERSLGREESASWWGEKRLVLEYRYPEK